MDDKEQIAGWRRNAATLAIVAMGLRNFAARLLVREFGSNTIDQEALALIREQVLTYAKNLNSTGMSIEEDAAITRQALQFLEQYVDSAISDAQRDNL